MIVNSKRSFARKVAGFFRSGRLLRATSVVNGLRNPRKASCFVVVFTVIFFLTDSLYLAQQLILRTVCPAKSANFNVKHWLCYWTDTTNNSSTLVLRTNKHSLLNLHVVIALTNVLSHTVFFVCFLRLDKKENALKPQNLFTLANHSFWLLINFLLVFCGLGLISSEFTFIMFSKGYYKPTIMSNYFENIAWTVSTLRSIVNCCLFAMITAGLKHCVQQCVQDIKDSSSNQLDDLIKIHQQLCAQVYSTSHAFTPWFITHWCGSVLVGAFYISDFSFQQHTLLTSWSRSYVNVWMLVVFFFLYIYPCYCAASVTSECRQILVDLNRTTSEDWHPGHPFQQRCQLFLFIQYAEYDPCGFKVGTATFGSGYTWISTLVILLSSAVKLMY